MQVLVSSQWHNVRSIHEHFGGLIGRDKIYELIKNNHIKARYLGRALAVSERELQRFSDMIEQTDEPIEFRDAAGEVITIVYPI